MEIKIEIHQKVKPKNKVSAEFYDSNNLIAVIELNEGDTITVHPQKFASNRSTFVIERRRKGALQPYATTASTNYHKAIGLAIKMAYDYEENT